MPRRGFKPDEQRSYERPFFVLVLALAGAVAWGVVDESLVRRPWKALQAEYGAVARKAAAEAQPAAPAAGEARPAAPAAAPRAAALGGEATGIRQLVVAGLERN